MHKAKYKVYTEKYLVLISTKYVFDNISWIESGEVVSVSDVIIPILPLLPVIPPAAVSLKSH